MNRATFISRKTMLESLPIVSSDYHAVISCNDTLHGEQEMKERLSGKCQNMTLFFQDTDNSEDPFSFSLDQAIDVIKFVKENNAKHFIIHCHAGISRSAAIARWIDLYLTGELSHRLKNYSLYNKHVFRTLQRAEGLL